MDGIIQVINKTYQILNSTNLTFGSYSFSLFAVLVSFACIGLVGWFVGKLFESR